MEKREAEARLGRGPPGFEGTVRTYLIFFLSLFTEGYGSCAQGFGSGRICLVLTGPTLEPSTVLYTALDPTILHIS